jgi:hypothetical protein
MKKITAALRDNPRLKTFALGGAFAALVLGSYPLIYPSTGARHAPEQMTEILMAPASFADQGVSARSMSKSAPSAMVAEMASAPAMRHDTRRVEETHRFTLTGERERIPDHYETAMAACGPAFCEILSGSLNDYGSTLEAQVSVRVDPPMFDSLIENAGVGSEHLKLVSHQRSAQDRTRQYEDIAARLESQKALRDRLMVLLESPTTRKTSDILEIEREIARTQGEIESLDAQRRSIETVTDRTTVHFAFRNDRLDEAPAHPPYLANAFKEAGTIFERSMANMVKMVAGLSPVVLFAGLVWLLVFRIIPAIVRRVRARRS